MKGNSIKTAPKDNKAALEQLESKESLRMFGDQHKLRQQVDERTKSPDNQNNASTSNSSLLVTPSIRPIPQGRRRCNIDNHKAMEEIPFARPPPQARKECQQTVSTVSNEDGSSDDSSTKVGASTVSAPHYLHQKNQQIRDCAQKLQSVHNKTYHVPVFSPMPNDQRNLQEENAVSHRNSFQACNAATWINQSNVYEKPPIPSYNPVGTSDPYSNGYFEAANPVTPIVAAGISSLKRPAISVSDQANKKLAPNDNPYNRH